MLVAWTTFALLAAVIAVAGFWLLRFGDVIAERTGLSGSWIGLALMATVTSLPELVTGIGAVRLVGEPDLALGDALGSCVFNLALLSVIDFAYRPACMFDRASQGHALSAGYGVVLMAVVGLSLLTPAPIPGVPISAATFLIAPIYLLALRTIFTFERRAMMQPPEPAAARYPDITLRRAVASYMLCAAFVVGAGLLLPGAASDLASAMGWTNTLVGTLFLAAATSLPEAAVVLSAVRIGVVDMAIATLLGSNLFNMVVLAIDDVAYVEGPLFSHASGAHLTTVLTVLLMTGLVTAGLIYRPAGRPAGTVSWVSWTLIAAYVLNVWLLFAGAGPSLRP
ncbi:MAG: sodium:calcium antiporter [Pseudomonadota bacterium]